METIISTAQGREYGYAVEEAQRMQAPETARELATAIIHRIDWRASGGTSETGLLGDALVTIDRATDDDLAETLDWWLRAYTAYERVQDADDLDLGEQFYARLMDGDLDGAEALTAAK